MPITEGHRWIKDYNIRPLCSGHGRQLHYPVISSWSHSNNDPLLNAAVLQFFIFLFRSHNGKSQVIYRTFFFSVDLFSWGRKGIWWGFKGGLSNQAKKPNYYLKNVMKYTRKTKNLSSHTTDCRTKLWIVPFR